jgi:hypothetical protein
MAEVIGLAFFGLVMGCGIAGLVGTVVGAVFAPVIIGVWYAARSVLPRGL